MASNISYNPLLTSNAAGFFSATTGGYIQGVALDDPAVRFALAGGPLATTETLPMWGGVAISESLPGATADSGLGGTIARATSVSNLTGFSVFNQAHNWVNTPQSECPSAGAGMTIPFYRLGSGARIPVACDPTLVDLEGGPINQQVSWDFNNQRLQPYDASTATIAASATVTWANTNGGQITFPVANWTGAWQPSAGDVLNISGATNSGTGGASAVNGNFAVVSSTTTGVVLAAPAASGVIGTIGGSPVLNFGTGALNVKVLLIAPGNSKIVSYDPVNNYVHWSNSGTTALILL